MSVDFLSHIQDLTTAKPPLTSLKKLWEVFWRFIEFLLFFLNRLLIHVDAPLYDAEHVSPGSNTDYEGSNVDGNQQQTQEDSLRVSSYNVKEPKALWGWWQSKRGSSVNITYCSSKSPKRRSARLHYPESREKGGCDIYSVRLYTACTCRRCILPVMRVYNYGSLIWFPLCWKPTDLCDYLHGGAAEGLQVTGDASSSGAVGHLGTGNQLEYRPSHPWHWKPAEVPSFAFPFTKGNAGSRWFSQFSQSFCTMYCLLRTAENLTSSPA